jgi:pimeloyl-ACP methyl ester carboxylesterase
MSTFVLVHGAWGGAHGFRHLRRRLQAAGHEVFTPSLTGIGERVHLASPLVGLGTHVRDVVHQVLYEDLQDIVLLGFSYGGAVVTGALEHIAERVRHLVYLDAFVPAHGESVWGQLRGTGRSAITLGEEWLVNGPVREFDDPAEAAWMAPRRTAHPKACFTEPVFLAQPLERYPFSRTYIKATAAPPEDPGNLAFWRAARHAQASADWRYHEIATNHMVANNRPDELAALLLDLVR